MIPQPESGRKLAANMKVLVVSAINFSEGGPLTILRESLRSASKILSSEWRIIALVHDGLLISDPRIETLAFPNSKTSWILRLWLEWWHFRRLSQKLQPTLWLSLHDLTPWVHAQRQAVYCHNPAPFHSPSLIDGILEPKLILFRLFYGYVYRAFIHRNFAVIVQQNWMRELFIKKFKTPNVIVSYPNQRDCFNKVLGVNSSSNKLSGPRDRKITFLYPALPRVFKNFEVLCEAMQLVSDGARKKIEVHITVSGSENLYSKFIFNKYKLVDGIKFIGRQSTEQMEKYYERSDVVVFPSRIETWGLPISEAKAFRKPLLVADLPYAHETVGKYDAAYFLPPDSPKAWALVFERLAAGEVVFETQSFDPPSQPFASDWSELWAILIHGL